MSDPRTPRLPGELEKLLDEQLTMLKDRCEAFYEGKVHEAKSAAAIIYTLLHDHGNSSVSLLRQLELKDNTKFLDSRVRSNLISHSARGAWPRTVLPYKQYSNIDLHLFDDWWNNQIFNLHYKDITLSRGELIKAIRNIEGGSHISQQTIQKIAAVRRSRSGWFSTIEENEDGSTRMSVMVSLTKDIPDNQPNTQEISDYELASVCAIAEEVLFSLTPEPINRRRMQFPDYQKPFYLSNEESDNEKTKIREYIAFLENLTKEVEEYKARIITHSINYLKEVLEIETLTSEDAKACESTSSNLKQMRILD